MNQITNDDKRSIGSIGDTVFRHSVNTFLDNQSGVTRKGEASDYVYLPTSELQGLRSPHFGMEKGKHKNSLGEDENRDEN